MNKQISDLSAASLSDLTNNCQFVMDDSNSKTKKVSFENLTTKISAAISSYSIPLASASQNGLMLSADKTKLDGLSSVNWKFDFTDETPSLTANIVISKTQL